MRFSELSLDAALLSAVEKQGYVTPTPVQREAIPHVLAGKDLIGLAQTGTGKTAAFALPILERLRAAGPRPRAVRVLVLAPTRELAGQIGDGFSAYGANLRFKNTVIFGGVGKEPQVRALREGVDIVVATPGRLLDLMGERRLAFDQLEVFVLDEADCMLDMGFIHDVKRIVAALPTKRQTLLFSATMPRDIADLAARILRSPVRVEVTPPSTTVEKIAQSIFHVENSQKRHLLLHLLGDGDVKRALVFTRTKHGANRVAEFLDARGVGAAAIHGNKSQSARTRALDGFKSGSTRVLVATDIAARGIDIDDITHVIQLDLPNVPEQYVHRVGRTARAGASGIAWSFCSSDERGLLRDIEKDIRMKIDVVRGHPYEGAAPASPPAGAPAERHGHGGRGHARPRRSGRR